jgi:hypothetical protein
MDSVYALLGRMRVLSSTAAVEKAEAVVRMMLAVWRTSEICIGIVCAGVVLAGTDFGGAQRQLAASIGNLAAEIMGRSSETLALAGSRLPDTQTERHELVRRAIALGPMIDQALGESNRVRYRSVTSQTAVHDLFGALDGWRGVSTHLSRLPPDTDRQQGEIIPERSGFSLRL